MRLLAAALMACSLIGCAPQAVDQASAPSADSTSSTAETKPAASNAQAHIGSWKATSAMMAGKPFPEAVVNSISLTLTKDTYTADVGGGIDKGTCQVDQTSTPNRMKITGTDGPNAGKTILAIVDFPEPDAMRIAYDLSGKDYPTNFESTAETGTYVAIYKKSP